MEEHVVKILDIQPLTGNVKRFRVEKPAGYTFVPGQATEVTVRKPGWEAESRPFTFTALPGAPYLEFMIKSYRDHEGVTKLIDTLVPGDQWILHDVWGTLTYRGPGLFLAGGAGITPFAAILRHLSAQGKAEGNRLIFANKTVGDAFLGPEFATILGRDFHPVVGPLGRALVASLLRPGDLVYLCGPDPMMEALQADLAALGVSPSRIVVED
jgi:ferredoxin-NADP reductase